MRLLPVLKSAEWQGPMTGARVHRWLGTAEEPLAYVAYAWESGEGPVYVTQSDDHDLDDIVKQSFENLEADEGHHEIVEADGSRLLVAAGQPLAAERVLIQRYMLDVHEALQAERLVVSVAKRQQLLATALDCSNQAKTTIGNLHREAWVSGGDERITERLIVLEDGRVADTLVMSADGSVDRWVS